MSTSMPPMGSSPATTPTPSATPAQPNPTSVFVLFEGPWVIDQLSQGVLRATTFNCLKMPDGTSMSHTCAVGFGNVDGTLANPLGPMQADLELMGAETWCITTPSPLRSQWKTITDLFDVPFNRKTGNDVFVYLKDPNMQATPHGDDRVVTFPTPNNVYLGGRLTSGQIVDGPSPILEYDPNDASPPMPHVTVIFEYTRQAGAKLELNLAGSAIIPLPEGSHLIFRMMHMGDTEPLNHNQEAFAELWSRLGAPVPTTVALSGVTDNGYRCGPYTAGFGEHEMGLVTPGVLHPNSYNPVNCGGGGYVAAGGSGSGN